MWSLQVRSMVDLRAMDSIPSSNVCTFFSFTLKLFHCTMHLFEQNVHFNDTRARTKPFGSEHFSTNLLPKERLQNSPASSLFNLYVSPWKENAGNRAFISHRMWLNSKDSLVKFLLKIKSRLSDSEFETYRCIFCLDRVSSITKWRTHMSEQHESRVLSRPFYPCDGFIQIREIIKDYDGRSEL